MKIRLLLVLSTAVALCSCSPNADTSMGTSSPAAQGNARIQVTRVGIIEDDLAYQERRGLYVIRDTKTGAEYIGVSGVGIVETGKHNCGKACVKEDER